MISISKKTMDDLDVEITQLCDKIEQAQKHNKIARLKCNLTKIKAIVKLGVTGTTITLTGTLISSVRGNNPFKLNDIEAIPIVTKYIDANGEVTETQDYVALNDNLDSLKSNVYYYTKWQSTENNNYVRTVYETEIYSVDINNILDLANSDKEVTFERFAEVFSSGDTNIKSSNEICVDVSEEEIRKSPHIEGFIRYYDYENKSIVKEKVEKYASRVVNFLLREFIATVLMIDFLKLYNPDFFTKIFTDIKKRPCYIDIKKIKKRLKEKQLLVENQQFIEANSEKTSKQKAKTLVR